MNWWTLPIMPLMGAAVLGLCSCVVIPFVLWIENRDLPDSKKGGVRDFLEGTFAMMIVGATVGLISGIIGLASL